MAQIDIKNATILLRDGSTPPHELEVKVGEGTLSFSEKRNIAYTLDRGILDQVKEGDQVPVSVNIDAVWEYMTGSTSADTTAAVNNSAAGYGAELTTSVIVNTIVGGPIAVGDTFTFAGETNTPTHTVTEVFTVTTGVQCMRFSPASAGGALASASVVTGVSGFTSAAILKAASGYASVYSMAVDGLTAAPAVGESFTVVGDPATGSPTVHYITAGSTATQLNFTPHLGSAIVADDAVITFTGTPTISDFLKRDGNGASLVSTGADSCHPYSVNIIIKNEPSCTGSNNVMVNETITLSEFRWEEISSELRAGTISITGNCNRTTVSSSRSTPA